MDRGRCKFCGHLLDAPSDNRDMAQNVVRHGKEIVMDLIWKGYKMIDICNFCYAHVSIFKKESPIAYDRLIKEIDETRNIV